MTIEKIRFSNRVTTNALLFHTEIGNIRYVDQVLHRANNGLEDDQIQRISQILNGISREAIYPSDQRKVLKNRISAELDLESSVVKIAPSLFLSLPSVIVGHSLAFLEKKDIATLSKMHSSFQEQGERAIHRQFLSKRDVSYQELEGYRKALHLQTITDLLDTSSQIREFYSN